MGKDVETKAIVIFRSIPRNKHLPITVHIDHPVDKDEIDRVVAEYPGAYISEIQRTGERWKFVFLVPGGMHEEFWSKIPERLGATLWGINS